MPEKYRNQAKQIVKVAMARAGVGYPELVRRLGGLGVEFSEQGLRNKIGKGAFGADFLLAVFDACGERLGELLPKEKE